ncbi:MAG: hypothetical protein BAJALOKI3v1_60042 [Promethearchaeota archaeon]|jgi:hypothetical protein|nr:MAG: hypothetical protein BAJALOKI3v1_60042 [Candidatus Lokiarchaeota archaeon]
MNLQFVKRPNISIEKSQLIKKKAVMELNNTIIERTSR